jgi:hypothetical protein
MQKQQWREVELLGRLVYFRSFLLENRQKVKKKLHHVCLNFNQKFGLFSVFSQLFDLKILKYFFNEKDSLLKSYKKKINFFLVFS